MSGGGPGEPPVLDRVVRLAFQVDPVLTLGPLRHGPRDPTIRFEHGVVWRASWTTDGPATLRLAAAADGWHVMAWGAGAERAFATLPRLLGCDDDPAALELPPGRLRELAGRFRGLRFGRSDDVMGSLVPAIIEQKVTGLEAHSAYHALVLRVGEPAPGPGGLRVPPEAATIAALPYFELHPLGIEQRRAVTLIRAAGRATWLQQAVRMSPAAALTRLRAIPGVGAWTAAETARSAFGDADAVSLGDFHTPHLVCWALAREPRGDDARMLQLLEPYRGQRARLVRLLELSRVVPPRYGPRRRVRRLAVL